MEKSLFVTAEVSRLINVSIDRIVRAHRNGLPEPPRAGHHRVYSAQDIERLRAYFGRTSKEECGLRHGEAAG